MGITDWDWLIFGDGSGSNWNRECGWGSVSVERQTGERLVWWGFANRGSVNVAEVMAYLLPLEWLANREQERVKAGKNRRRALQIHVVTDSQYVQGTGEVNNPLVEKNGTLWERFDSLARRGLILNWHWLRRDEVALNSYADELSKLARREFRKYNLQERVPANRSEAGTVYDVNPDG